MPLLQNRFAYASAKSPFSTQLLRRTSLADVPESIARSPSASPNRQGASAAGSAPSFGIDGPQARKVDLPSAPSARVSLHEGPSLVFAEEEDYRDINCLSMASDEDIGHEDLNRCDLISEDFNSGLQPAELWGGSSHHMPAKSKRKVFEHPAGGEYTILKPYVLESYENGTSSTSSIPDSSSSWAPRKFVLGGSCRLGQFAGRRHMERGRRRLVPLWHDSPVSSAELLHDRRSESNFESEDSMTLALGAGTITVPANAGAFIPQRPLVKGESGGCLWRPMSSRSCLRS